ncbi:NUMOD4 domain-containing protein [Nonomuraea sp. MTCD27]|uniref:NUMOD4 domain-containing protein n=1 Tax=Nonomuraea sp. MTCD27 TaxID=1676747 RepID=UPI0035C19B2C
MGELTSETWIDIAGYEGHYQVSDHGQIRSLPRFRAGRGGLPTKVSGRILRPGTGSNGYLFVILSKNARSTNARIHRLVAAAFLPNPEQRPEVNHLDGDKTNNHVTNLEWATRQENVRHACETGLMPVGPTHWRNR